MGVEIDTKNLKNYKSKIDLIIRPFKNTDINTLKEGQRHSRLVKEQIPDCYIATTKDNINVYRQWYFKHDQNEKLKEYFGPIFPKLKENEAIIEGVFTHVDFRGMSIMPNAIYKILKQDQHKDVSRVIAFVKETNIGSLKGFYRIGFKPYTLRQEKWFLFKRTVTFIPVSSEIHEDYTQLTSSPLA